MRTWEWAAISTRVTARCPRSHRHRVARWAAGDSGIGGGPRDPWAPRGGQGRSGDAVATWESRFGCQHPRCVRRCPSRTFKIRGAYLWAGLRLVAFGECGGGWKAQRVLRRITGLERKGRGAGPGAEGAPPPSRWVRLGLATSTAHPAAWARRTYGTTDHAPRSRLEREFRKKGKAESNRQELKLGNKHIESL